MHIIKQVESGVWLAFIQIIGFEYLAA